MKILLITSGQPSLNPRLVKEADALTSAGFEVTVIYQFWNAWATVLDKELLKSKKWNTVRVGGDPVNERARYYSTRLFHGISKILFRNFKMQTAAIGAVARSSYALIREAKNYRADFYIGHNLGALPAAVLAARANKKKCGFDAEDFHRREVSDNLKQFEVQLSEYLERKFFPYLSYLTTASPLISKEYKKLFTTLNISTVLNVFPKMLSSPKVKKTGENSLRLFWFSQTVGANRGLEDILQAIGRVKNNDIQLHLLGSIDQRNKTWLLTIAKQENVNHSNIFFYDPIHPDSIIPFASQFDIGLATEIGHPVNRNICLTNKIFTYVQSGLAVLASNTLAQTQLLDIHHNIGVVYEKGNIEEIAMLIASYFNNPHLLKKQKKAALELSESELNWETESKKFLRIIESELT